MKIVWQMLRRLWKDDEGQSLVEYGLLAALIALAVVAALYLMGNQLQAVLARIQNCLQNTASGNPSSC